MKSLEAAEVIQNLLNEERKNAPSKPPLNHPITDAYHQKKVNALELAVQSLKIFKTLED